MGGLALDVPALVLGNLLGPDLATMDLLWNPEGGFEYLLLEPGLCLGSMPGGYLLELSD